MRAERGRSRWPRALTAAKWVAAAGIFALLFALADGRSSLSAGQLSTLRVVFAWCLALAWPLLLAYILWKAREDWLAASPRASRWTWWVAVACMVLLFTPVEYTAIAYLIPELWANTNLLIASVVVGIAGPVVLMWIGFHIAALRRRPEDDYLPRSR